MNKELLKEYLSGRYQGWSSFLDNVIFPIFGQEDFEDGFEAELLDSQPERRELAQATGIHSIKQVGKIYVGVEPLQIFDVTVSDRVMMERNRVNIQRLIRTVMDQFSCAFMLFHYEDDTRWDWRFTYCRKSGNKEESTDSKRYTFLLGPGQSCRTATDNFMGLYDKRDSLEIKDIEDAFNVEALSKEFFGKYKAQYEAFVSYMIKPDNGMRQNFIDTDFDHTGMTADKIRDREEKPIRDYVKKLLGRIVFLHFLQKKGWLGVPAGKEWGEGDHNFMLHLFENASEEQKENFLDDILEDLFAKGLDCNRSDRGDLYDTKVEGFRNHRIPYLNGGLFERDNLDEKTVCFPSNYFKDLLTMLSQYNFTIDENDPNDAEVGVDPEMLGRIFENLLEDNKDKGAFYTPKEIVQYMCRESLIAYLQTDQKEEDKEPIRQFVTTHDVESLGELKEEIEQKLIDVKICDPAIGSGAFPMGLLRELFLCRSAIEPNIVEKAADIKRHIIQNNIYGVDIERGAVEIARLRFWLALIVEEKSPEVLPNLDFKIMQGNSLLESYEGIDLSKLATTSDVQIYEPQRNLFGELESPQMRIIFDQADKLKEFQANLKRYFEPITHEERTRLRNSIDDYVRHTIAYTLETHKQSEERKIEQICLSTTLTEKQKKAIAEAEANMVHLNEMIENVENMELPNSQFFLWHTWFHDVFSRPSKEGFDIVIGNPPYFKYEGSHKEEINTLKKQPFLQIAFGGKLNAYKLFLALAVKYLTRPNGIISYIFQNSFMGDLQAYNLRKAVICENQPLIIDSFPERDSKKKRVFESVKMSVCIVVIKATNTDKPFVVNFWDDKNKSLGTQTSFTRKDIIEIDSSSCTIPRIEKEHKGLVIKLKTFDSLPLKCYEGELNMTFHKKYFSEDKCNPKILKGASIQRYYITEKMSQGEIEYLNENAYLEDNSGEKTEHHKFERVAMQGMTGANDKIRIIMSIVPVGFYLANSCNYLIPNVDLPTKYLVGLMNSKVINWFFRRFSTNSNVNGYEVESFPIPKATKQEKETIASKVDEILKIKGISVNADTKPIENEIDCIVYKLFGLSEEEISIVEG